MDGEGEVEYRGIEERDFLGWVGVSILVLLVSWVYLFFGMVK